MSLVIYAINDGHMDRHIHKYADIPQEVIHEANFHLQLEDIII